jgi:hypothetical protein
MRPVRSVPRISHANLMRRPWGGGPLGHQLSRAASPSAATAHPFGSTVRLNQLRFCRLPARAPFSPEGERLPAATKPELIRYSFFLVRPSAKAAALEMDCGRCHSGWRSGGGRRGRFVFKCLNNN